jgi:hypothetical protein
VGRDGAKTDGYGWTEREEEPARAEDTRQTGWGPLEGSCLDGRISGKDDESDIEGHRKETNEEPLDRIKEVSTTYSVDLPLCFYEYSFN